MSIRISFLALLVLLGGCYGSWKQADSFARSIDCSASRQSVTQRAESIGARVQYLNEENMLQVQKESDTVAIQFDKQGQIIFVALSRVEVVALGLHRRKLDTQIVLTCPGRYR